MPHNAWTEVDNAKLRSLAGKFPVNEVAARLARSTGATVMQASKLKVSLRMRRHTRRPANPMDVGPAGLNFGD